MARDRCNYFSCQAIFSLLTPLTAQKLSIFFKMRKAHQEISFYTCVPKIMTRQCLVPEIWCAKFGKMDRQKK